MSHLLDTVLVIALPAAGKSEIRKYMASLPNKKCEQEMHTGPTVQLDDFPYVRFMGQVDRELYNMGEEGLFFWGSERCFRHPADWGTLIHLLNEDYANLLAGKAPIPSNPGRWMLQRIDKARRKVRGQSLEHCLPYAQINRLAEALRGEADKLAKKMQERCSQKADNKTIIIEFARGGSHGSAMPLAAPLGYQYSLSQISDEILNRCAILYIWIEPEESRRRNEVRADPNRPGSILHHKVPLEVMMSEYGCDDIQYLMDTSPKPGRISVSARGKTYYLRLARFDNRTDKTSFIRSDRKKWKPAEMAVLHAELKRAMNKLIDK